MQSLAFGYIEPMHHAPRIIFKWAGFGILTWMMKSLDWFKEHPRLSLGVLAALLCTLGFVLLYHATVVSVSLIVDGQERAIRTHAQSVGELLQVVGVDPGGEGKVIPGRESSLYEDLVITYESPHAVMIEIEGERQTMQTAETLPANILAAADVLLYPGDRVWVNGVRLEDPSKAMEEKPTFIRVVRAAPITLTASDYTTTIYSAAPTLGEALWEAGIVLREVDQLTPGPETPIDAFLQADLERARQIVVSVDGLDVNGWAVGSTVGEALVETGISLVGMDYTLPDLDEPIPEDGRIRVIRVREQVLVELEPLPFSTVYQAAPDLEIDTMEVLDAGQYGVLASRVRIRLEDGEEVDRTVEEAWEAAEPSPRVLGYGTNIVVRTLATGAGTIEYWRAVPVYATSYSPCNSAADQCYPLTASGKSVKRGVIGVIRSWYNAMPGWPVYVPNYGTATIEDIGAGIAGKDWIDLGFTDEEYEIRYGWTTLYFLTPVPPAEYITWILP
jgi:uncharacterized protein YabE (DUF348 family)